MCVLGAGGKRRKTRETVRPAPQGGRAGSCGLWGSEEGAGVGVGGAIPRMGRGLSLGDRATGEGRGSRGGAAVEGRGPGQGEPRVGSE